jgi:hypothetical protein
MKKDPIYYLILFYILGFSSVILLVLLIAYQSHQPGDQTPFVVLMLSPFYLSAIGTIYCLYSLFFYQKWDKKDRIVMVIITIAHLSFICWFLSPYFKFNSDHLH